MKTFLRNNIIFFIYFAFSIIVELSGIFVITKSFFVKSPWLLLTISLLIFSIYNFIKSRKAKNITISILLILQAILSLVLVVVFDNTGTYFDFNMLKLIGSNNNFVVTIDINYWFIIYLVLLLSSFITLTVFFKKYQDKQYRPKSSIITSCVCVFAFLISHISVVISTNYISEEKFMNSLYRDTNEKYVELGTTGTAFNELYKMAFFNKYNKLTNSQIEEYIYTDVSTPTDKFGISKGNNLITILVESFEWFGFISDTNIYPNGANLSNAQLDDLYPNLRRFYNMSVVMNNHYSENKTDMSEDEALLGVYTSGDYMNYSFESNTLPTSIANTFKLQDTNISNNFAHNNDITFYNRNKFTPSLGYENLYFINEMVEEGATDYMAQANLGGMSMNLDSEMVETMKDYLFTKDKRFNTHLSTVTMHGNYVSRPNMKKWEDKMSSLGIEIENDYVKNYMIYVMEFDYALGLMLNDLESKNLLDNTTIVIFSDHNAYMNHLSQYVKNIYDYDASNYNELVRVPLMIYDPNIDHQIINKFTTTYDITPTILDMFGINYYTNLYYGNSIFSNEESVLYSKAFDVFIADGLFFSNINNILYKSDNVTDTYIKEIESKCLALLKKIFYTNHIFYYDYFDDSQNYSTYITKINLINNF